jgi:hypothetical protein
MKRKDLAVGDTVVYLPSRKWNPNGFLATIVGFTETYGGARAAQVILDLGPGTIQHRAPLSQIDRKTTPEQYATDVEARAEAQRAIARSYVDRALARESYVASLSARAEALGLPPVPGETERGLRWVEAALDMIEARQG